MSFLGNLFGGGSDSHTTTTSSSYPDYVQNQQKRIYDASGSMDNWINNPSYQVAGLNGDQTSAGDRTRSLADWAGGTNNSDLARGLFGSQNGSIGLDYSSGATGMMGRNMMGIGGNMSSPLTAMATSGERVLPTAGQYSAVNTGDALALANPYMQAMQQNVMGNLADAHDTAVTQAAGDAARSAGSRGSGAAIRKAMADKNLMESAKDATAQIAYDSYGQGANMALANQGSENNAISRLTNAGLQSAQLGIGALQAADGAQNNYFNRMMGSNQYDANMLGMADQLTQSNQNRNINAGRFDLDALGAIEGADTGYQQRAQAGIDSQMGYGDKQQHQQQLENDQDYEQFKRFAQFVPGYQATQTQTSPVYNSTGGSLLGGGLTLGRAFGLF